jgi:HEPN domain-containing protein
VAKAETDAKGAAALARRRKDPLPDLICFHSQQCIEKYLKAVLVHFGVRPPRIHDVVQLLDLCPLHDPSLRRLAPRVGSLNAYGVLVRYPGTSTTPSEAGDALAAARVIRRALRRRLGL